MALIGGNVTHLFDPSRLVFRYTSLPMISSLTLITTYDLQKPSARKLPHQEIPTLLILTNFDYFGAQIVKIVVISKNSQK